MAIFSNLGFRARSAWNAFFNKDPTPYQDYGPSYSYRQLKPYSFGKDKSVVPAVLTRFSVDSAAVDIILEKDEFISPHVMSEEHFNKTIDYPFLTNVLKEGVVIE